MAKNKIPNIRAIRDWTNNQINDLKKSFVITEQQYYLDKKDEKWGVNTDPNRGADTFVPFKNSNTDDDSVTTSQILDVRFSVSTIESSGGSFYNNIKIPDKTNKIILDGTLHSTSSYSAKVVKGIIIAIAPGRNLAGKSSNDNNIIIKSLTNTTLPSSGTWNGDTTLDKEEFIIDELYEWSAEDRQDLYIKFYIYYKSSGYFDGTITFCF